MITLYSSEKQDCTACLMHTPLEGTAQQCFSVSPNGKGIRLLTFSCEASFIAVAVIAHVKTLHEVDDYIKSSSEL